MIIKGKSVKGYKNNITDKACPVCKRKLRFKNACCGQLHSLYVCVCGYKEIVND